MSKTTTNLRQLAQASASNLIGDSMNRNETLASHDYDTSNMNGASRNGLGGITFNPTKRKLGIVIENTTRNSLEVPLFDANGRFELPEGINITYDGFTKKEVENMLLAHPFVASGLLYRYGDEEQLEKQFIVNEKIGEETRTRPYDPSLKEDASAEKSIITDPSFELLTHAGTTLFVPIAPATMGGTEGDVLMKSRKVKLIFNIATSVDTANALKGASPVEKHGTGFRTKDDVSIF